MKLRWIGYCIAAILFILVLFVILEIFFSSSGFPGSCSNCSPYWVYAFDINQDTSLENFTFLAKQYLKEKSNDPEVTRAYGWNGDSNNLIFSKSLVEDTDEGKIILVPRHFRISSYQHSLDEDGCTNPSIPCFLTCSLIGPPGSKAMGCGEPERSKINTWFPPPEDFFKVENGKIFKRTKFICHEAGTSQIFNCTSKEWTEIKWNDSSIELVKFKIDKQGKVFLFVPRLSLP